MEDHISKENNWISWSDKDSKVRQERIKKFENMIGKQVAAQTPKNTKF